MTPMKRVASKSRPFLVSDLVRELENRAPAFTAEKWDNVGLLVGDPSVPVTGVVVSIDLTAESIRAAKQNGYSVIVNHHPCIFPGSKGLVRVNSEGESSLVYEAVRSGIAVIAAHTNFDQCALEVTDAVSTALGIKPVGRLFSGAEASFLKLVVFVPSSHLERVRDAVCAAGAGKIGRYDTCTFSVEGEGTFRGDVCTDPFLGKPGVLEHAKESRLETVFPKGFKRKILAALRSAHPYEEVAYDLYRVEQEAPTTGIVSGLGYGVYGDYAKPISFSELEKRVKKTFQAKGFFLTEPKPKHVKRIGFVAGKGSSFIRSARAVGCELFITGEAGYHDAREAAGSGIGVLELGHRESEIFFLQTLEQWCGEWGLRSKTLNTPVQSCHS